MLLLNYFQVRVGRRLRFAIGYLRYEMMNPYAIPPEAIAGIATGIICLILVFAIVLVLYRRKSTQAEREYKRIQIQMDTLESNVRSECKQGKFFIIVFQLQVFFNIHMSL